MMDVAFVITLAVEEPKADWLEPPRIPIPALLFDCSKIIIISKTQRIINNTVKKEIKTPM